MKLLLPLVLSVSAAVSAQQSGADPKRVVAVIEGVTFTADDLIRMTNALGPAIQTNFKSNPQMFVEQFGLLLHLQNLAEQEKLQEQDPHRWRLLYNRALYLAQARMNAQNGRRAISPDEQEEYYKERQSEFSRAKVRVIYLAFSDKRDDAATEKLATEIAAKARSGADFPALVKAHSDDADSKAKDGVYPEIKPNDNTLPPAVKAAIFQLKPGQVSDPIRQSAGFWIFKLESFVVPPYAEVKDEIFNRIMDRDMQAWMEGVRKEVKVEIKDPAFFAQQSGASQAQAPLASPAAKP